MTLKTRNRLLKFFFVFSLICIFTALISFAAALFNKAITPPPALRIPRFIDKIPFLKYSFTATMISVFLLIVSVPVTFFFILKLFEATQSSEIIFFTGFLTACLAEGVRFLTPLFGLWSTFSNLLFLCGRILFMGRLLAPLSFVFAAIASTVNQRQDVERNLTIMFAITLVFSIIVPINTAKITSAGAVTWGFPVLFMVIRILCVLVSFITFFISSKSFSSVEFKKIAFSMLFIFAGYSLLVTSDNYVMMALGFPLFAFGISCYLKNLHSLNNA